MALLSAMLILFLLFVLVLDNFDPLQQLETESGVLFNLFKCFFLLPSLDKIFINSARR